MPLDKNAPGGSDFDCMDGCDADDAPATVTIYGPTLLEQFALAIIRAHPSDDRTTDAARLKLVLEGLLGGSPTVGRPIKDDSAALGSMSMEASRRGQSIDTTTLARNAAHLTTGASHEATVARLVRRYQHKGKQVGLHLQYEDEIAVDIERQILEAFFEVLRRAQIPFARPTDFRG